MQVKLLTVRVGFRVDLGYDVAVGLTVAEQGPVREGPTTVHSRHTKSYGERQLWVDGARLADAYIGCD